MRKATHSTSRSPYTPYAANAASVWVVFPKRRTRTIPMLAPSPIVATCDAAVQAVFRNTAWAPAGGATGTGVVIGRLQTLGRAARLPPVLRAIGCQMRDRPSG